MRVTIFDAGAGNLHSLRQAIAPAASHVAMESDPARCVDAGVLVLPGVGAFAPAARALSPALAQLRQAIDEGLPVIGICLGMQLLFDASDEGEGRGLGVLPGRVTRLRAARVPQMGWNFVEDCRDPLAQGAGLRVAYFANGFVCRPDETACVTAWTTHEDDRFPAIVRANGTRRVLGFQFHPEKSSRAGVRLLRAALGEAGA
jgi:glutamine amidotransferase